MEGPGLMLTSIPLCAKWYIDFPVVSGHLESQREIGSLL